MPEKWASRLASSSGELACFVFKRMLFIYIIYIYIYCNSVHVLHLSALLHAMQSYGLRVFMPHVHVPATFCTLVPSCVAMPSHRSESIVALLAQVRAPKACHAQGSCLLYHAMPMSCTCCDQVLIAIVSWSHGSAIHAHAGISHTTHYMS